MVGGKMDPFVRLRRIAESLVYLYVAKVLKDRKIGEKDAVVRNRDILKVFSRNGMYYRTMNYREIITLLAREGLIIPYETKTHLEIRLTLKGEAYASRVKPFIEWYLPLKIE